MKSSKTKDVNDAVDYLKQQFWQYGTNEIKYNYTRNEFKVTIQYVVHCMCIQYLLGTLVCTPQKHELINIKYILLLLRVNICYY